MISVLFLWRHLILATSEAVDGLSGHGGVGPGESVEVVEMRRVFCRAVQNYFIDI